MKPIWLIAGNFLREHRWPMVLLVAVVFLLSAPVAISGHVAADDVMFFLQQQIFYAVAFSVFLSAAAVHNERRTRRILAVLSKGLERGQYLAGLITGVMTASAIYCLAVGLTAWWMFARNGLPADRLWLVVATLLATCAIVGTLTLFFTTMLPPLFATLVGGIVLAISGMAARFSGTPDVFAAGTLLSDLMRFPLTPHWQPTWTAMFVAILDSIVLWFLASLIFARRDVAVAIE
jgi:hypothetical protein